MSKKTEAQGS